MTLAPITLLRNFSGMLFVLPFLVLPLLTIAPTLGSPSVSKQGAGLVLLVSLQRSAMR